MISTFKYYNFNVKPLSSTTLFNFRREHTDLSIKWRLINKGYSIDVIYNKDMVDDIEKDIVCSSNTSAYNIFTPVILKNDIQYMEEGEYMGHCVASYIEIDRSIIISLRKKNSQERVTSEFRVTDGLLIQSRYFHNTNPPDDFTAALEHLNEKVLICSIRNILVPIERIKTPFLNGEKKEEIVVVDQFEFLIP